MKYRASLCLWGIGLALLIFASQAHAQFEKKAWPKSFNAPPIEYTDLSGKTWNWQQLKGKVVVLNFWATWCAPCLEELPSLQTLQDFTENSGVVILTINVKETPSKIQQFVARNGFNLPVIADRQGEIAKKWAVKVFPTSMIVSAQRKPTWIVEGPVDWTSKEASEWLNVKFTQ